MKRIVVVAAGLVLAFFSIAQAGFVSFDCSFPDDPTQAIHNWTFTGYDSGGGVVAVADKNNTSPNGLGNASSYSLVLAENISKLGYDQVSGSGVTDSDPIFHIQKTVTNSGTVAWTSYELMLNPTGNATFVIGGNNHATIYNNTSVSTYDLIFSSPNAVQPGQTVVLDFDIAVPLIGPFNFCLTQNPIPEPATICMLGLGALGLLRKRIK